LVEFSLAVPIVLLILMILLDFGRVIYAQNTLNQDVALAARMASTADFCQVAGPPARACTAIEQDAMIRQRARTISPLVTVADCAITGDLPDANCSSHAAGGAFVSADGTRLVVKIVIQVPMITPLISNIVGPITVSARADELLR
jgi:hypothetical protein